MQGLQASRNDRYGNTVTMSVNKLLDFRGRE
jgi:hypothetical protein